MDGAWDIDLITGQTALSSGIPHLLGHPVEDIPETAAFQSWFLSQIHPEDVRQLKRLVLNHWKRRNPFKVEFRFQHSNGQYQWLMARGNTTFDPQDKPVRFTGYFGDIHHRKQTEHALRVSELRLKEAQALARIGHWELDLISNKLHWSHQIYSIFELNPETFAPSYEAFLNIIHPEDRQKVNEAYLHSVRDRTHYTITHRLLMDDGRIKYVEENGETIYDADLKPIRSIGTVQDITEQEEAKLRIQHLNEKLESLVDARTYELRLARDELEKINSELEERVLNRTFELEQANRALSEEEDRYRTLFEGIRDGIAVCDPSMQLLFCNKEFENLTGYTRDEMEGINLLELVVHPEDCSRLLENNRRRRAGEKIEPTYEFRWIRKTGEIRIIEGTFDLIFLNEKLAGIQGLCRDITEKKAAENELKKLNEELEIRVKNRTQDLEQARDAALAANRAKSEFLSRVSHELRTPLTGILGFSRLLEMADLPGRNGQNAGRIHKAGQHLLDLINEMLDLSRIEAGTLALTMKPVNVQEFMCEMTGLVEPMAKEFNVSVCLEIEPDLNAWIQADHQRLRQVIWNLASNGIKYNKPNGALTFSVNRHNQHRIQILVSDTGRGIPTEKIGRLFSPFDRLDIETEEPDLEGTGLGLSLCKRLVEAMDGNISATSKMGQGSTFKVEFKTETEESIAENQQRYGDL